MDMNELVKRALRFIRSEDGPTAVEYAVMLALILLVAVASIALFGEATNSCFEYSRDEINKVVH
jgi:pilus assembly protein Flp/PilA